MTFPLPDTAFACSEKAAVLHVHVCIHSPEVHPAGWCKCECGATKRTLGELWNAPKPLTDGEEASLHRIAELRAYAGQLRAAIQDAADNATSGTVVASILSRALEIPFPPPERTDE